MATAYEYAYMQCCECLRAFTSPGRTSAHRTRTHRRWPSNKCVVCKEPVEVFFEDYHRASEIHKFAVAYRKRTQAEQPVAKEAASQGAGTATAAIRAHAPPTPVAPPPRDAPPSPHCGADARDTAGPCPLELPEPTAARAQDERQAGARCGAGARGGHVPDGCREVRACVRVCPSDGWVTCVCVCVCVFRVLRVLGVFRVLRAGTFK